MKKHEALALFMAVCASVAILNRDALAIAVFAVATIVALLLPQIAEAQREG